MDRLISSCIIRWLVVTAICASAAFAQATPTPTPALKKPSTNFFKDVANDQKAIWTSPFHVKRSDLKWMIPFGAATAGLVLTDKETSNWVKSGGSLPAISRRVSWGGSIYATAGAAGGMWAIGKTAGNDKLAETGRLATEALINAEIVTQVSKVAFGRLRPDQGDGEGRFFKGGRSFFSGHSSGVWAVASVVACEYSNEPLAVFAAYGLASAVSLSRYTGRRHFLSDVVVGAGVGYGIAHFVCGKRKSSRRKNADTDPTTLSWRPSPSPYLDPRTGNVGARLSWHF